MKRYIGIASIGLSLIFNACGQKNPEQDNRVDNNKQQNTTVSTAESKLDTIAVTDNNYNNTIGRDGVNTSRIGITDGNEQSHNNGDIQNRKLNSIYFRFNKFNLNENMMNVVNKNIDVISSYGIHNIKIEGNCDEWGTDEYNYALGVKRAKTVRDELIANGIPKDSLILISYGESNPTCTDKTDECWQNNRRVELKIID